MKANDILCSGAGALAYAAAAAIGTTAVAASAKLINSYCPSTIGAVVGGGIIATSSFTATSLGQLAVDSMGKESKKYVKLAAVLAGFLATAGLTPKVSSCLSSSYNVTYLQSAMYGLAGATALYQHMKIKNPVNVHREVFHRHMGRQVGAQQMAPPFRHRQREQHLGERSELEWDHNADLGEQARLAPAQQERLDNHPHMERAHFAVQGARAHAFRGRVRAPAERNWSKTLLKISRAGIEAGLCSAAYSIAGLTIVKTTQYLFKTVPSLWNTFPAATIVGAGALVATPLTHQVASSLGDMNEAENALSVAAVKGAQVALFTFALTVVAKLTTRFNFSYLETGMYAAVGGISSFIATGFAADFSHDNSLLYSQKVLDLTDIDNYILLAMDTISPAVMTGILSGILLCLGKVLASITQNSPLMKSLPLSTGLGSIMVGGAILHTAYVDGDLDDNVQVIKKIVGALALNTILTPVVSYFLSSHRISFLNAATLNLAAIGSILSLGKAIKIAVDIINDSNDSDRYEHVH